MGPSFVIEAPKSLMRSRRLDVVETFGEWLFARFVDRLPDAEIVVQCSGGDTLKSGGVGEFVVFDEQESQFPDAYILRMALGKKRQERDVYDWHARLVTLPHELLHLIEWYEKYGGTPAEVVAKARHKPGMAHVPAFHLPVLQEHARSVAAEHGSVEGEAHESLARKLTDEFLDEHPALAWPV